MRTATDAWFSWSVTALTSVTVGLGGVDGLAQEGLGGRLGHGFPALACRKDGVCPVLGKPRQVVSAQAAKPRWAAVCGKFERNGIQFVRPHALSSAAAPQTKCGRTGDHAYCHTLTIADLASRYLPTCLGLRSTNCERAKPIVECAFREYGLPRGARSAGHERPGRSPCAVVRSSPSDFSLRIDGGASQRIATDAGAHHSGEVAT